MSLLAYIPLGVGPTPVLANVNILDDIESNKWKYQSNTNNELD